MARCEDFPCCGHDAGDCPDSQGRFTCVECGKRLARTATSSICLKCQRRMRDEDSADRADYYYSDRLGY